jgi:hypothetical protein
MWARIALNRWFPPLKPVERRLLDAVAATSPPEYRELLRQQLDHINFVQRLSDGKEINFYCIRDGRPSWDPLLALPDQREESKLATVHLRAKGGPNEFTVDVWIVKGYLFSLEANKSLPATCDVEVLSVDLHAASSNSATSG